MSENRTYRALIILPIVINPIGTAKYVAAPTISGNSFMINQAASVTNLSIDGTSNGLKSAYPRPNVRDSIPFNPRDSVWRASFA
jgi:hypothetical protein